MFLISQKSNWCRRKGVCRRCTDEPLYRLKGKQVGILYDLVTVIRECRYESFTPLARMRREGKYLA